MYKQVFEVTSNDIDCFYKLKVSSLYSFLQETALKAVESIGGDSTYLKSIGLDWVITLMEVNILKTPVFHDLIIIYTYPGDDLKILYPRYFRVEDSLGNVIIKASSLWGLMEIETRKLCLKKHALKPLEPEHSDNELSLPYKIEPRETILRDKRKIYFSDIDLNGHLNNCAYIRIFIDLHDIDFYECHEIINIKTFYLKELKVNDEIELCSSIKENEEYIEIKKAGELVSQALIKYIDK